MNKKHTKLLLGLLLVTSVSSFLGGCSSLTKGYSFKEADNSKGSVGYEIFVRAFEDGNGDGIGDLKGLTNRLDYLKDLGIKRIWLMPVMPSSSYHKYDVDDYFNIDKEYGTLDDFDEMVTSAHQKGIDVIIDLVLNHTSSNNKRFLQSRAAYIKGSAKADWYCWSKTPQEGYNKDSSINAYYESRFSSNMPELNLDNEDNFEWIKSIVDFWIKDHKIDGFRLDATTYYFYQNILKNVEFIKKFSSYVRSVKSDAYIVGEAWENSQNTINEYAKSGINFFNFPTSEMNNFGFANSLTSRSYWKALGSTIVSMNGGIRASSTTSNPCCFITNHDQNRWDSYFAGPDQDATRKLCVSLYLLTPGTPWMYYGEEIAMNGPKDTNVTDAGIRQAMVWGKDEGRCKNSSGYKDTNQNTVGALDALKDDSSLINHYKKVINVRNLYNEVFEKGEWSLFDTSSANKMIGFKITLDSHDYYLLHNAYKYEDKIKVPVGVNVLEDVAVEENKSSLESGLLSIKGFSSVLLG